MTKAEILKKHKLTEAQFLKKYSTPEAFAQEYPEDYQALVNGGKIGMKTGGMMKSRLPKYQNAGTMNVLPMSFPKFQPGYAGYGNFNNGLFDPNFTPQDLNLNAGTGSNQLGLNGLQTSSNKLTGIKMPWSGATNSPVIPPKVPPTGFKPSPMLYAQAGELASSGIQAAINDKKIGRQSFKSFGEIAGSSLAKGIGYGAAAGSVIPGIGTLVGAAGGAIVGGVAGLVGASNNSAKMKKAEWDTMAEQKYELANNSYNPNPYGTDSSYAMNAYNGGLINMYADGGNMYQEPTQVDGGQLNHLASDAQQVASDNPQGTDNVNLGQAMVDNNEVIQKNKVYSDNPELVKAIPKDIRKQILVKDKTFAITAARQDKLKGKFEKRALAQPNDPINKNSIQFVQNKLDKLFDIQEQVATSLGMRDENGQTVQTAFNGGKLRYDNGGWDPFNLQPLQFSSGVPNYDIINSTPNPNPYTYKSSNYDPFMENFKNKRDILSDQMDENNNPFNVYEPNNEFFNEKNIVSQNNKKNPEDFNYQKNNINQKNIQYRKYVKPNDIYRDDLSDDNLEMIKSIKKDIKDSINPKINTFNNPAPFNDNPMFNNGPSLSQYQSGNAANNMRLTTPIINNVTPPSSNKVMNGDYGDPDNPNSSWSFVSDGIEYISPDGKKMIIKNNNPEYNRLNKYYTDFNNDKNRTGTGGSAFDKYWKEKKANNNSSLNPFYGQPLPDQINPFVPRIKINPTINPITSKTPPATSKNPLSREAGYDSRYYDNNYLLSTLGNIAQALPFTNYDKEYAVYNPNENEVTDYYRQMPNKVNIQPTLNELRRQQSVANFNASGNASLAANNLAITGNAINQAFGNKVNTETQLETNKLGLLAQDANNAGISRQNAKNKAALETAQNKGNQITNLAAVTSKQALNSQKANTQREQIGSINDILKYYNYGSKGGIFAGNGFAEDTEKVRSAWSDGLLGTVYFNSGYQDRKKLIDKVKKDNPNMTDEQIIEELNNQNVTMNG